MLTITCEDNMALMSRYPDKHFDLAIVDPPYFRIILVIIAQVLVLLELFVTDIKRLVRGKFPKKNILMSYEEFQSTRLYGGAITTLNILNR